MRQILTVIIVLFSLSNLTSQLPYTESFETMTGWTADANIIDNLSDYFARMDTECNPNTGDPCEVNFNAGYSGWNGTYYWAGEDHDDPGIGNNPTLCITLDAIDISANSTGMVNISVMAAANDVSNAYEDNEDHVTITYAVDGGAAQNVHYWAYYSPDGGTTEFLAYDANNNGSIGTGETDILTETFETKSRNVSASGNNLVIVICAHSNASSEEWAVDNIVVTSVAAAPVELVNFTGKLNNDVVLLSWETASEINHDYFEIQKSADGIVFESIGRVDGEGNSSVSKKYAFSDNQPFRGLNYYRLKQTDLDGSAKFYDVISVKNSDDQTISIFPNPAVDFLTVLSGDNEISETEYRILNTRGQMLKTGILDLGLGEKSILEISDLPADQLYLILFESRGGMSFQRFFKR